MSRNCCNTSSNTSCDKVVDCLNRQWTRFANNQSNDLVNFCEATSKCINAQLQSYSEELPTLLTYFDDAVTTYLKTLTGYSATGSLVLTTVTDVLQWAIGGGGGSGTVTSVGLLPGTGISISGSPITTSGNITVTNTAPDQTVIMTSGTGISITGTYPSFTITNTSPSSGGTLTAANNGVTVSGTTVQLGQTFNQAGNPAALLHSTEIPLGSNMFKLRGSVAGMYFLYNEADNDGVFRFHNVGLTETIIRASGFDYGWVKMWVDNTYDGSAGPGFGSVGSGIHMSNSGVNSSLGQFIHTAPGNVIISDGLLLRDTGAGGIRVTADAGLITFTQGVFGANEFARFTGTSTRRFGINTGATVNTTVHIDETSITNTQDDAKGLQLSNSSAATSGFQQLSPSIHWKGAGWKTTATAASQSVDFRAYVLPVQGTTNPSAVWYLQSSINGGGYTNRLGVTSAGALIDGAGSTGSSNYVLRSNGSTSYIEWVDITSLITPFALTNGNGTTAAGTAVDWGGVLIGPVDIDGGDAVRFGSSVPLTSFSVIADTSVSITANTDAVNITGGDVNITSDPSNTTITANRLHIVDGSLTGAAVGYVWTLVNTTSGRGAWSVLGAASLDVGTTTITGGASGKILYDGGGVLGELSTIPVANGGTNISSYAVGDILYASGSTTLSKLADVAAGSYLRSGGVTTAPLWSTLILPNAATVNQLVYATSTNTYGGSANLTFDGNVLTETSGVTTGTTTASAFVLSANSLTSGTAQYIASSSLTSGNLLQLISTGTVKAANNELLDLQVSGANGTSAITVTGARISVTNTNVTSGTNVGIDITASGATTDNIAVNATGAIRQTYSGTTGATTSSGFVLSANSLTTGTGMYLASSSLQSGNLLQLVSSSTALAANNELLDISSTGVNGTNAITATGVRISVTNTNVTSGTNRGIVVTATGATTGNVALEAIGTASSSSSFSALFTGRVAMGGCTAPFADLDMANGSIATGSIVVTTSAGTNQTGNFSTGAQGLVASNVGSIYQVLSSSTVNSHTYIGGTGATAVGVGLPGATLIIGAATLAENSSGTHPLFASLIVKAPTISGAAATLTNQYTVYIEGAPAGTATNTGSLWVDDGLVRFDAGLLMGAGTATAGTAPIKLTTGTSLTAAEAGALEYTTPQLFFTNGGAQRQELFQGQQSRVSAQFDSVTTTLANVTGLTATLVAGKIYRFDASLFIDANATGGSKYAIAGTATATAIIYEIIMVDNTLNTNTITSRQTALAGSAGQAGTTAGFVKIRGLITVNAAGTLTVQFAQNAASGTSSVLVGSHFIVTEMA